LSNFDEEFDLSFQNENEIISVSIHEEIEEWFQIGNKAERKERDLKYGKWARGLDRADQGCQINV